MSIENLKQRLNKVEKKLKKSKLKKGEIKLTAEILDQKGRIRGTSLTLEKEIIMEALIRFDNSKLATLMDCLVRNLFKEVAN